MAKTSFGSASAKEGRLLLKTTRRPSKGSALKPFAYWAALKAPQVSLFITITGLVASSERFAIAWAMVPTPIEVTPMLP